MPDVSTLKQGTLGRIVLNRPAAINALSLEMVQAIAGALDDFASDPGVAAVLLTGEGARGLCAGGDIRWLYAHGRDGSGLGERFFRAEYRLNARIAAYPKPYIAIMDGIVMGGGVGISAHGGLRIVTERTRLAMPETGLGFFPDIGATWLLSRAPGEIGVFLGLTGDTIGGADAILACLADRLVPSARLAGLIEALADLPPGASVAQAMAVADRFAETAAPPLGRHLGEIDACFGLADMAGILAALRQSGSDFARHSLSILEQRSPTALKLTLVLLRAGAASTTLRECQEREFAAALRVLASDEFYEGVRAAVVDKDRRPQWRPATLDQVTPALLAGYLEPALQGAGPLF